MPSDASLRPSYTPEQLDQYFEHIKLPRADRYTKDTLKDQDTDSQLTFLAKLTRHHLCTVPFENLDLHYSTVKGISLDSDHLFHKVVERNAGRGGYCMQNNSFYGTVLRSLGFSVMSAGARVSKQLDEGSASLNPTDEVAYGGYGHQVNIITISGKKFFVDVGFGSSGPTFPVPLVDGYTSMNTGTKDNISTSMHLRRGFTTNNTSRNPEQQVWIYSTKFSHANNDSKPWIKTYCFAETEFFPADFDIMSHWVSTNRASIFVQMVVCQKFIMTEDGNDLIGDVTLHNGEVKERRFGKSKVLATFKSEEDRVQALEKYLNVKLSKAEIAGITGFPSEIK